MNKKCGIRKSFFLQFCNTFEEYLIVTNRVSGSSFFPRTKKRSENIQVFTSEFILNIFELKIVGIIQYFSVNPDFNEKIIINF